MLPTDIDEIVKNIESIASKFSGKTILITGGRGFLGRYFTAVFLRMNETLKTPCKLIVMDNLITAGRDGSRVQEYPNTTFIQCDISQPIEFNEHVDFIIHGAGIASPFYYRAHPIQTLEVATIGTKAMLEIAKFNQARIVFFSSSEIYGDPDPKQVPIQESYRGNVACQGPRACYDESKRLGETLCYIYHQLYGTSVSTIRPFNVYGPGMQEADYRVLPNFASRIKGNRPLNIYGSGSQTRTFCYISDAIAGFLLTLINGIPGEAYNIGNPNPEVSMVELADAMEAVIGRPIERILSNYPDSYPGDEPQRRCPDIRKAKIQLKFEPKVSLDEGLRRFLEWTDANFTGKD